MSSIIVTCALPYANGPLHLGHILENIQADIWVRYNRLKGKNVYFLCADDAHGTAIMLKAKEANITPEEWIKPIYESHTKDLKGFYIIHDHYYSTHSEENKQLCEQIYNILKNLDQKATSNECTKKFLINKEIEQLFDEKEKVFLPDRFVKGICPRCDASDQYGDNCENCGATYDAMDLKSPISVLSNSTPSIKKTKHLYFNIATLQHHLIDWLNKANMNNSVLNKIKEWVKKPLQPWNITRDKPYFGFEVPDFKEKCFYVWLDAPIGYMATFKSMCKKYKDKNIDFYEHWQKDSTTKIYHFIGKDIINFHCIFWPCLLLATNYNLPSGIYVHGYVSINGEKMSKSKGNFISASAYLRHLEPDYLRYYFASKLSNDVKDINLDLIDFESKVNADLVNNLANLASRVARFFKEFDYKVTYDYQNIEEYKQFVNHKSTIEACYEKGDYYKIIEIVSKLVKMANSYVDQKAPWKLSKQIKLSSTNKDNKDMLKELHCVISAAIDMFRIAITYLQPIVPCLSEKSKQFLNHDLSWDKISMPMHNIKINSFAHLISRVERNAIEAILKDNT